MRVGVLTWMAGAGQIALAFAWAVIS